MLAVILFIFVIVIIAMLRSHSKLMNQVIKDHGGKEHSLEENILLKLADALINHQKTTKSETATLDKPKDVNEMTDEELLESVKEMLSNASAKPAEHSRKSQASDDTFPPGYPPSERGRYMRSRGRSLRESLCCRPA